MGIRYTYAESESFRTEPIIVAKNITANGTYDPATDNADGYAPVTVNVEGGGTSYTTVFEGSVTTEASGDDARAIIQGYDLSADTIKVTFNGVEYTCPQLSDGTYGAPFDDSTDEMDWSEYPFCITPRGGALIIQTETAGTYTLKIEEPQSGGSSDFSTAQMTISGFPDDEIMQVTGGKAIQVIYINSRMGITTSEINEVLSNGTYDVVLYQGVQRALIDDTSDCAVSGDATLDAGTGSLVITGNFTLAYSGE